MVSAYLNVVLFAVCGGYIWFKLGDEKLKKETKKALLITLLFVVIGVVQTLVGQCLSLFNVAYTSTIYDVHQAIANIITIARILVYTIFTLIFFFKKETKTTLANASKEETAQVQENSQD